MNTFKTFSSWFDFTLGSYACQIAEYGFTEVVPCINFEVVFMLHSDDLIELIKAQYGTHHETTYSLFAKFACEQYAVSTWMHS